MLGIGHLFRLDRFRLPKAVPLALGATVVAVAMVSTFSLVPKEKSPWQEYIDSALKRDSVALMFFYQGEPGDFRQEFRLVMELEERYGASLACERIDAAVWDDAARKFNVSDFPTILIIEGKNKKGYIVYPQRFAVAEDRDALVAAIDEVLASKT